MNKNEMKKIIEYKNRLEEIEKERENLKNQIKNIDKKYLSIYEKEIKDLIKGKIIKEEIHPEIYVFYKIWWEQDVFPSVEYIKNSLEENSLLKDIIDDYFYNEVVVDIIKSSEEYSDLKDRIDKIMEWGQKWDSAQDDNEYECFDDIISRIDDEVSKENEKNNQL